MFPSNSKLLKLKKKQTWFCISPNLYFIFIKVRLKLLDSIGAQIKQQFSNVSFAFLLFTFIVKYIKYTNTINAIKLLFVVV